MLRDYQQRAFDSTVSHIETCTSSCVIDAATGSGKSHIIASLAEWIIDKSGARVLCLAPSKELVEQNHEKYCATGASASIYCATAGFKCLSHSVVFGSPKSVLNSIDDFGSQFCAVIVDEAHGITPTIKNIIAKLKELNPNIRVIGLSATPYRMGTGYIYEFDQENKKTKESINPYFKKLICRITARELIDKGWLTQPVAGVTQAQYNTSKLKLDNLGRFDTKEVSKAFLGRTKLTNRIVKSVIELSKDRNGVMFFASTIDHAKEIIKALPEDQACIVTSETKKKQRSRLITRFKERKLKYIVNVGVLTTGFDAPHVDVIAVLRATESASLFQQIIGRGLRLFNNKEDCLVLDFAGNIERHGLEDDLFEPEIEARAKKDREEIEVRCPECSVQNQFAKRLDEAYEGFPHDDDGYFIDLAGKRINTENGPLPAHYGRRCNGAVMVGNEIEQCSHRWSLKVCPMCDTENDIAARKCISCGHEIISPDAKLKIDFKKMKKDPYTSSTDKVLWWRCQRWVSKAERLSVRIEYKTEYRIVSFWYRPATGQWVDLCNAVFGAGKTAPTVDNFLVAVREGWGTRPKTITSNRRKGTQYFNITGHNKPIDKEP